MSSLQILIVVSLNVAVALAQTLSPSFNTRQDIYSNANALILADLNGDGIVDTITSQPTVVSLRKGDGTFGTPVVYSALGVAFGNGDGTFQSSQTDYILPGPSLPISLATGDFNGDGRIDVAVATGTGGVFIYLNQGGGALALAGNYFPGRFTAAVTAEDIDGDGFLDLAVGVGEHVTFLMGSGTGAFRTGQTFSTTYPPGTVLFAELNNDGIADMVVSGGVFGRATSSKPICSLARAEAHSPRRGLRHPLSNAPPPGGPMRITYAPPHFPKAVSCIAPSHHRAARLSIRSRKVSPAP